MIKIIFCYNIHRTYYFICYYTVLKNKINDNFLKNYFEYREIFDKNLRPKLWKNHFKSQIILNCLISNKDYISLSI